MRRRLEITNHTYIRSFFSAGRPDEQCKDADGRELWVLAEMYELDDVRQWLVVDGIDPGNVCAAHAFGCVPLGNDREGIVLQCNAVATMGLREDCSGEPLPLSNTTLLREG